MKITREQATLIELPFNSKIFLEGPAGAGKTTAAVERLLGMLSAGVRGDSILLLVPQRTLAEPYYVALRQPELLAGSMVTVLTFGGLAQRMIDLFWPIVAEQAGFTRSEQQPRYLTLETAQYYMAHLVRPLIEEGLFSSVTIEHNRLYSQILDNLNKAAVVGFPYTTVGERLKSAWMGEPGQLHVYDDVQTCVNLFRDFCLAHNMLDYSLQVEVFWNHLWPTPECRNHLIHSYRHLIIDNLEENVPIAHDLVREWFPNFDSVLLIYDWEAGYRRFLGADPESAYQFRELCRQRVTFQESLVCSPPVRALGARLAKALNPVSTLFIVKPEIDDFSAISQEDFNIALEFANHRFYPTMLDWVSEWIASQVFDEGIPAGEIVVLAPFLSDALRFSLTERLSDLGIPARAHRPSRSLREEPTTQCLLTLSAIAHPAWDILPTRFDVAYALMQAIEGMDLIRSQILTDIVYRPREGKPALSSFDLLLAEKQARITYRLGERFEKLRVWLESAQQEEAEFDHFISRLFGELLSQPGYGFHASYTAGDVTAKLIESVQKFRWAAGLTLAEEGIPLGKEYLTMVQDGVIAAQYLQSWRYQPKDAVLLAPAYTFLLSNRPVDMQIWLDAGSRGWSERLYQPLTHPYVLSRNWPQNRKWSDEDEVTSGRQALYRLASGLLARCRRKVVLGLSDLGEQGYEQRGPLLQAFQRLLRESSQNRGDNAQLV